MSREKKICLLTTGGTIASVVGENGLAPALGAKELFAAVPELAAYGVVAAKELFCIDSTNVTPEHWRIVAETATQLAAEYDGFIVTHGTDTLAYTAAALHYMLAGLNRPVVLTGSMLPIDAAESDAKSNLLLAAMVASGENCGVFVAFAWKIFFGDKVSKINSVAKDAFAGEIAATLTKQKLVWRKTTTSPPCETFSPRGETENDVAVFRLVPSAQPKFLAALIDAAPAAVIIEGYGAGGVPQNFLPTLERAREKNVAVFVVTQCATGGTHLDIYETGALAALRGAKSAANLTIEALTAQITLGLL